MPKFLRTIIPPAIILLVSMTVVPVGAAESLDWQQCLAQARSDHPDILSGRESIVQAQAEVSLAFSEFLPGVDFGVDGDASWDREGSADSYSHGFSGSQLIFNGLQNVNEFKRAKAGLEGARHAYQVTSSNVRRNLRRAFVNLMREKELSGITQEILKRRQDSLELVKLRYDAGREHKGALLTAQANLAQAQADVHAAGRSLDLARRRMIKELGRNKFSAIEPSGTFDVLDPQIQQPDFEALADETPALKEFVTFTEQARYDLKVSKGAFLPEIFLSSRFNRSDNEWPPRQEDWSVGVSMEIPIFDGGERLAFLKRSKAGLRQANAFERSARDGIIVTLHESWAALQNAVENTLVQQKFLASAETRAKISESQYSNGLISFDDWIIIEDTLVRTKTAYLDARANALLAEADWHQAKGVTLDNE
jgi:outer membrane protein TolC